MISNEVKLYITIYDMLQAPSVSYDFIEGDNDPSSNFPWHGTSCGGIIGAVRNDVCGVGIAYDVNLGGM